MQFHLRQSLREWARWIGCVAKPPSASPLVAPPSPVSWVSVERVCDHSFIIRLAPSPGATGYDVNLSQNGGASWQRIASDVSGNSYMIDTDADYGPGIIVSVRSRNGSMESEWRNAKATRLSASAVNASAATFTLDGHSGGWWLKRVSPTAGECVAGEADFSHRIGGLDAGTGYTFQAYGDSTCQRDIGGATFTTSASSVATGSVSNVGEAANGTGIDFAGNHKEANGFTTGSNVGGYTLKSVTWRLRSSAGNPGDITVAIHEMDTNDTSSPATSTALYTLSGNNPSTAGDYTFSCAVTNSVSCGLSADTTYFLVMKGSSPSLSVGYFYWETTQSDNQTGDAGWAISDVLRDYDGSAWRDKYNAEIGLFRVTAVEK